MEIKGTLFDVHLHDIYSVLITIEGGKIERIKREQDVSGPVIMPGLIDSHVHIESSMLTPGSFARACVPHGTIGVLSDPHEIANVLGIKGVDYMIKDAEKVPVRFWFGAPSCVPATDFETNGARLDINDIISLLQRKEIKYLAEMMNFPGVLSGDAEVMKKIEAAKRLNKKIDGHAPGLTGKNLKKYVQSGISTDHECSTIEEAKEKLRHGMKILIREGSAARNMDALKDLIKSNPDEVMLCSDDLHPEMLRERHINKLVSILIKEGYDPYDVVRSASVNPATHYGLDCGLLREGDPADFIIVDSPEEMNVLETWINGNKVFDRGHILFNYKADEAVNHFNSADIDVSDIQIINENKAIRIIRAYDGELLTKGEIYYPPESSMLKPDPDKDILKIIVKDRYYNKAPASGFIRGFNLKSGAFASSVAHDSHNIIAVGANDEDIVAAVNEIIRLKGGMAVASAGRIDSLQLNIAGLMSSRECTEVAGKYELLSARVKERGCTMQAPFMTLSFMALLVIPELKLGDRGLFDVTKFTPVPLFIS